MKLNPVNNIQSNKNNYSNKIKFKALPTKVCGFCKPEDVGVVLDSAANQQHSKVFLGFLMQLKNYAMKGLSLEPEQAGYLFKIVREGSYQRNTPVEIAHVNHYKNADDLLENIEAVYDKAFNAAGGLRETAEHVASKFSGDTTKLLRGFDLVQVHDDMPVTEVDRFVKNYVDATRNIFNSPNPRTIKAIHVPKRGEKVNLKDLEQYALMYANSKFVDGLILDSSNLATHQIGGTGMVNDWIVAHDLVDIIHKKTGKPVGLAGGICPSNVSEAIRIVKPDFIDGNTGFRQDRPDKNIHYRWRPIDAELTPPKDAAAVNYILQVTSNKPSSVYFDKHLAY